MKLDHTPVWLKRKIERALALFLSESDDANVRWLGAAKRTAVAAHRQGDRQYSPSMDVWRAGAFDTNSNAYAAFCPTSGRTSNPARGK
jgi:hypothetical protein